MKSLIIGASAGLGRALAEELAKKGDELFLVASDARDLESLAKDLQIRFGLKVSSKTINLNSFDAQLFASDVLKIMPELDNLFLIAGLYDVSSNNSIEAAESLIDINFRSPVRIAEAFLSYFESRGQGNIVGAGSIAAIRPREAAPIYGAAKRALEFYVQALRHRFSKLENCQRLYTQFYRLGYLDTQMTFGKKLLFPALSPSKAAKIIVARLNTDVELEYLPSWWCVAALVYRCLPWFIFKHLKA
jgi:short-subunit dehydrogenase